MAGLSEMMQYAQAQQKPNPVAQVLESAVRGGFSGYGAGVKERSAALERQKMQLEIESKVQEMKMQENMAKYFGFIPYSADELEAARGVAFDELGTKPKTHTKAGGLESFYNPETENLSKNYSTKGGFSLSVSPKKGGKGSVEGASSQLAERTAIETLATKMALRQKALEFKRAGRKDEEIGMLMRGYVPTPDEVKKNYPLATEYYKGDQSSFDALYNDEQSAEDPQNLFSE